MNAQSSRNVHLSTFLIHCDGFIGIRRPSMLSIALCLSCLLSFGASIFIIERDIDPTVFVTTAATSDKEPIWVVMPMLLDVQPVLFKADVMHHVPAQIQSFCREHGLDTTRCAGAIQEALDEVVNWQRFCKKPVAESALPGFVVTKHVIREDAESVSTLWLHNDPKDIATDFCGFAQAKSSGTCVEALEQALQLSFDWVLALPPCEQQSDSFSLGDSVTQSVADRLAAVEEMIAVLTSENDVPLAVEMETTEEDPGTVEEIREAEIEESITTDAATSDDNMKEFGEERASTSSMTNDQLENTPKRLTKIQDTDDQDHLVSDFDAADKGSSEVSQDQRSSRISEEEAQTGFVLTTQEEPMEEDLSDSGAAEETEENVGAREVDAVHLDERPDDGEILTIDVTEQEDLDEIESTGPDAEGSLTNSNKEAQKSWKIGAALVLTLSILYLVIDLMLHCVRYLVTRIKAPKQLISVLLHDILVLVGMGRRSTLKNKGDKLTKPAGRRPQAPPSEEAPQVSTETHEKPLQPQVTAPYPLTTFSCAAMLMAGCISIDSIPLAQDTQTSPSIVQDSNEALSIIQQQYDREFAAAQRIQSAWKSAQRKSSLKREWERAFNGICMVENSNVAAASPIKTETQQPPALRRLVPNTLPPL